MWPSWAGTLNFNDTLVATFDDLVTDANAGVDGVARAPSPVELGFGQRGVRIDPGLVEVAAAADGVDRAAYLVFGYAQLLGPDGAPVGDQEQAPALGLNWVGVDALNPYDLVEGAAPAIPDEIVIDRHTAQQTGYGPGDVVTVLTSTTPTDYTVSGIATVSEGQGTLHDEIEPFKVFMLVFAFVALFVGSFIINNTFTITVAHRTKEMAMLRAIGVAG